MSKISNRQKVIDQISKSLKHKEREIAIRASMGGYYSAIKIVQDMITKGKNIADLSTFCAAELSRKETLEQVTEKDYLNKKEN